MSINTSIIADCADELYLTTLAGAGYELIGTLTKNPILIVFDNQGSQDIEISKNGTSTWHTFPAGEALVLDMRANNGKADNMTFPVNTSFYAKGVAGAANFSISYLFAVT